MNFVTKDGTVILAGGDFAGKMQQQTAMQQPQQTKVIIVTQDNTAVWVAGVAVPIIIACIGWWLQSRWRKEHPGMPLTVANIKKSREK